MKTATVGDLLLAHPDNVPEYGMNALESGTWEKPELGMIKQAVKPTHRVLEGGTCLGLVTTALCRISPYVITFEANEALAGYAQETFKLNDVYPIARSAALSDHDGELPLFIRTEFWNTRVTDDGPEFAGETTLEMVPCVDVNRIIRDHRINCLVLDVEGAEYDLLAHADLSPIDTIVAEFHRPERDATIGGYLTGMGFKLKGKDYGELNWHGWYSK